MSHKKDGFFVWGFKPGDEIWIGPIRIILHRKRVAVQTPDEQKIEIVKGPKWKKGAA